MNRMWWPAALALCAMTGCVSEGTRGDLRTMWTIGLDEPSVQSCTESGIDTVQIALSSETHDETEVTSCPTGQRTFRDLPMGRYTITISGLDETGCPVYEGTEQGVTPEDGGVPSEASVVLQRLPSVGTLAMEWRFEDGRMCGSHDVESVSITILANDVEQVSTTLDCDDGLFEVTDIPTGSVDVRLEAANSEETLCHVETNLELEPCGQIDVTAILEPCF